MYNPYQGQPQNIRYQTGDSYYQQQPQQPQQPQPQSQPQLQQQNAFQQQQPQQQMQPSYSAMQQPQQPTYGMGMQQPQQNANLQATQLGGMQNYQQTQQQPQQVQSQVTQPLQQQGTGYYSNMSQQQQPQAQQPQLQPQGTGYYPTLTPSQPQLQTQVTNPMQVQQMTQTLQPQVTNQLQVPQQPLLPQQTGFYVQQSQVPLEPLKPTATGFVNSFANSGLNNDVKIPAMRLSFITANDQAKFETLFRSVVKPGSNTITGTDCRAILLKSGLQPSQLAKIWALCDTSKAGELLFPEFALAMHLINNVLQGDSIPYELETKTKNEVNSFIDAISLSIASSNNASKTPFDEMITAGISTLQPQPTGLMPSTSFGMPAQITGGGMVNQMTGGQMMPQTSFGMPAQITGGGMLNQITGGQMMPQTSFGMPPQLTGGAIQPQVTGGYQPQLNQTQTGNMMMPPLTFGQQQQAPMQPQVPMQQQPQQMLQAQATGYLPPSNFNPTMPLMAQKTGFGNNEIYSQTNFSNKMTAMDNTDNDRITPEEKSLFYNIFQTYDSQGKGLLDSPTAVEIFRKSGLNRSDLEHIWNLCDINNSGQLNKQEFALGMHLVYRKLNGNPLPNRLPPSLIPSSNQILDNVKNQLKNDDNSITSQSKINALNFKNNDEEDVLPTFRNRRKVFSTTNTEEKKASPQREKQEVTSSTESVESKYPPIDDISTKANTAQQTATRVSPEPVQATAQSTSSLSDELKLIEKLQSELKNIIPPTLNSTVSSDLQTRFENVFTKIPTLFAQINDVEKEITDAKIKLFRLKNPSSITGTGANGEITENDRKKAKSRALLRSRMATLTGKQSGATDEDESVKFNEEIGKIKKEGDSNQEVIDDVKTSISEISASLKSFLIGKALDNEGAAFERWEFGIGLEPETQNVVHQLNIKSFRNETSRGTKPESKSEDSASQKKELAHKRMKERLAKFGLNRSGDRASRSRHGTVSAEDVSFKQESPFVPESSSAQTASDSTPVQQHVVPVDASSVQNENDSEDEEEKKLKEKLQELKLRKKAEKEKRLAELRKQLADAQAEDSDDDIVPITPVPQAQNTNPTLAQSSVSQESSFIPPPPTLPVAEGTISPSPSQTTTPAINNAEPVATEKRNPFFKPSPVSSTSAFDSKAAEAQRRIQRGINDSDEDDDDWSDDENDANKNVEIKESVAVPVPTRSYSPAPVVPQNPNVGAATITLALPPALVVETEQEVATPQKQAYAPVSIATPPVPVAPPVPSVEDSYTPPVPVAAPVPTVTPPVPVAAPVPTVTPPVPVAPPVPSVQDAYTPPVSVAPPIPSVPGSNPVSSIPPVPLAPPHPGVADPTSQTTSHTLPPPPTLPANVLAMDEPASKDQDNDDVLSIPESVDSETGVEFEDANNVTSGPPAGIPPPPPLPNI
ncbi:actin organization and endocytosis protein [Monosporozyma unispora]|nr:actin organization and endocytosis protein [Kazachstania unispora]